MNFMFILIYGICKSHLPVIKILLEYYTHELNQKCKITPFGSIKVDKKNLPLYLELLVAQEHF